MNTIIFISLTVLKSAYKKRIFWFFYFLWKQLDALFFLLFHSHGSKLLRNHQIASSRAKIRSKQSQTCANHRVIISFIKRNADVHKEFMKILHQKMSKYGWFSGRGFSGLHKIWWRWKKKIWWKRVTKFGVHRRRF